MLESTRIVGLLPLAVTLVIVGWAASPSLGAAPAKIIVERVVDARRADVWAAWTTREGLRRFFGVDNRVELRIGGPFEVYFTLDLPEGSRGSEGCRVLSYVENEMLSFTWNAPPTLPDARWQRSFVVVQLADAADGGTRVRITHDGFKDGEIWEQVRAYFDAAWPRVLESLAASFADPVAASDAPVADDLRTETWVYYIRPCRSEFFESPTPEEIEVMGGHVAHITGLLSSGRLILAGPSFDPVIPPRGDTVALDLPAPGIVVFLARDEEEARQTMEADPAVANRVMKATLRKIRVSFARDHM